MLSSNTTYDYGNYSGTIGGLGPIITLSQTMVVAQVLSGITAAAFQDAQVQLAFRSAVATAVSFGVTPSSVVIHSFVDVSSASAKNGLRRHLQVQSQEALLLVEYAVTIRQYPTKMAGGILGILSNNLVDSVASGNFTQILEQEAVAVGALALAGVSATAAPVVGASVQSVSPTMAPTSAPTTEHVASTAINKGVPSSVSVGLVVGLSIGGLALIGMILVFFISRRIQIGRDGRFIGFQKGSNAKVYVQNDDEGVGA